MIRQPALLRELILSDARVLMKHMRVALSMRDQTEFDVLSAMEQRGEELEEKIINCLMEFFGHPPSSESRFSQTARAVRKKRLKGPRGEVKLKRHPIPSVLEST